jgi:hypothetical protein
MSCWAPLRSRHGPSGAQRITAAAIGDYIALVEQEAEGAVR